MKRNVLLFLKTPTIKFRKKAISVLKKDQLTPIAQYGNIALEMSLTETELKIVSDSDLFAKIYNGPVGKKDLEKLSDEAREIAATWNLGQAAKSASFMGGTSGKEGLSWGTQGFDEPRPHTDLSKDFFLTTLKQKKIPPTEMHTLTGTKFSPANAVNSFTDIKNKLLKSVKDETKVYHLSRLAIIHPELEETILNLPANVIDVLFKKKKNIQLGAVNAAAATEETCWKMNGEISVGVIFVESSRAGGPVFTATERTTLRNEIQTGLNWLASENEVGNLSWVYDYQNASIDVANGNDDSAEDYWRDPAMQAVSYDGHSYSGNWSGVIDYREDMRITNDSAHAIVIFVTPFGTEWHAYASAARLTLANRNNWGGWGIDNINTIAAHETCHLFGAADEYTGSGTPCSSCTTKHGCDQVVNGNCQACANPGVPCVMDRNALEICKYTRGQIGWRPKEELLAAEGILSLLRVHDVGTGYGPPDDKLDAEVIVGLKSKPGEAFGFQLRQDANKPYHKGMLDVLRNAFQKENKVRIEYVRIGSNKNSKIVRVINLK